MYIRRKMSVKKKPDSQIKIFAYFFSKMMQNKVMHVSRNHCTFIKGLLLFIKDLTLVCIKGKRACERLV